MGAGQTLNPIGNSLGAQPLVLLPVALCLLQATDFKTTGSDVLTAFQDWVSSGACGQFNWSLEPVNHEGVRINVEEEGEGKRGWLLLRQSLHDPLLVLNMESDTKGGEGGPGGAGRGGGSWNILQPIIEKG